MTSVAHKTQTSILKYLIYFFDQNEANERIQNYAFIAKNLGVPIDSKFKLSNKGFYSPDFQYKVQNLIFDNIQNNKCNFRISGDEDAAKDSIIKNKERLMDLIEMKDNELKSLSYFFYLYSIGYNDLNKIKSKLKVLDESVSNESIDKAADYFSLVLDL